jgi:predicted PurR-regulated permease PerM
MSDRTTLLILSLIALVLVIAIMAPFGASLFMGGVLAATLHPLQRKICGRWRCRPQVAAGLVTAGTLALLVLPLAFVAFVVAGEIVHVVEYVREFSRQDGLQRMLEHVPSFVRRYVDQRSIWMRDLQQELVKLSAAQSGAAALAVGKALAATGRLLLHATFMLIALFFLLLDGERLVMWIKANSPLPKDQTDELVVEFQKTSKAALVSTVVTAGIQACVALVGYFIVGLPQAFFFSVLTFVVGLIPAVGAGSVVVAVAVFQLATGHMAGGVFLLVWGLLPVALVDNLVKPLLIGTAVQVHGAIVFFSLMGGLAVFGPVGLVAGPLIVAFFQTTMRFLHPELVAASSEARGDQVAADT